MKKTLSFFFVGVICFGQDLDFARYGLKTNRGIYPQYWESDSSSKKNEYSITNLLDENIKSAHVFSQKQKEKWFYVVTTKLLILGEGLNKDVPRRVNYSVEFSPQRILIANGYWKSKELWEANSRVKKLKYYLILGIGSGYVSHARGTGFELWDAKVLLQTNFVFENKMEIAELKLDSIKGMPRDQNGYWPLIHLFIIDDVYPGSKYPDDICISEINFQSWEDVWYKEWGIPLAVTNTNR